MGYTAKLQKQHGFTLLELLLYIAIVSTLLGAVSLFLSLSLSARVKSQSIAEVNQQGIAVLEKITHAVRSSSSITSPAVGASGTSLTLAMPTPAVNPTIFDSSGSALQIKEASGAALPLTNTKITVTDLTFKNVSQTGTPGAVHVRFTLSRVNTGGRNEYDYQKTFTMAVSLR